MSRCIDDAFVDLENVLRFLGERNHILDVTDRSRVFGFGREPAAPDSTETVRDSASANNLLQAAADDVILDYRVCKRLLLRNSLQIGK